MALTGKLVLMDEDARAATKDLGRQVRVKDQIGWKGSEWVVDFCQWRDMNVLVIVEAHRA
jgi:hypothetical protein